MVTAMAKETEKKEKETPENEPETMETPMETETPAGEEEKTDPSAELAALRDTAAQQEEKYLRLAAEYDNYRKRTTKEKENAWASAKAETVKGFLSVYDDLERALKQETADEAYRKGVEMIMTKLKKVLSDLGVEEIPAQGETFDANVHNAVMHVEDEALGENTVKEVYQTGFKLGDTVIRYAMVVVAN